MTTWIVVPYHKDDVTFGEGFFGYGLFGGGPSWTAVSADDSEWEADSADDSSWEAVE